VWCMKCDVWCMMYVCVYGVCVYVWCMMYDVWCIEVNCFVCVFVCMVLFNYLLSVHHTSYIIHHTSHTSYISYIIHHTSYIIHYTSSIIHHTSIHHTSYIIHHTYTHTPYTHTYIIHHTSHFIHHTSHIIQQVGFHADLLGLKIDSNLTPLKGAISVIMRAGIHHINFIIAKGKVAYCACDNQCIKVVNTNKSH